MNYSYGHKGTFVLFFIFFSEFVVLEDSTRFIETKMFLCHNCFLDRVTIFIVPCPVVFLIFILYSIIGLKTEVLFIETEIRWDKTGKIETLRRIESHLRSKEVDQENQTNPQGISYLYLLVLKSSFFFGE